ncbi:PREDICTED: FAD-linked sulfhydryl oxidase ERV1-like [Erythranthe guttata]|uniref:FAD-linked sulfhydryl oxidase ERV1-like n=1 Tax=Erythranthe guttata TaxID=4155 RepID=UPI00064D90C7|nr:PREDICTED: FAD-linked sulfhydryl oxidase ERV1-like [Erythranthe guttata]|eukprot:XP_012836727.1 PREDICTED: FAD-linked sulfhydryl oxidase ERV1-like [Erythranthe guttata]
MSENPLHHLFQAFGNFSECVQTHLSQLTQRPAGKKSPPSLSTNRNSLVSLSSNSAADTHIFQPAETLEKFRLNSTTQGQNFDSVYLCFVDEVAPFFFLSFNNREVFESKCPTTKEDLGRATWTFLHTLAAQYPDKPSRQQKMDVKELMAILSRMYPCKECADHFKEVIRSNPVEAGSHHEFSQWVCRVHNVVNRSLGKLVFPCERVEARWGKLECEQRACDLQGTSMNFSNELK